MTRDSEVAAGGFERSRGSGGPMSSEASFGIWGSSNWLEAAKTLAFVVAVFLPARSVDDWASTSRSFGWEVEALVVCFCRRCCIMEFAKGGRSYVGGGCKGG